MFKQKNAGGGLWSLRQPLNGVQRRLSTLLVL